ncbi:MAG: hypothetical protein GYB31_12680 [Bacteroidetes bacterium]|nr:hypothetical protein [Bacteroidota bacterium]
MQTTKRLLIFLILLSFSSHLFSQAWSVQQTEPPGGAWAGLSYCFEITPDSLNQYDSVIVSGTDGPVKHIEDQTYCYYPSRVGESTIFVYDVHGDDSLMLARHPVQTKPWPDPEARLV